MGHRGRIQDAPLRCLPIRGLVGFQEVVWNTKISTWVSLGVPMEILSHDAMINESGIFMTEAGKYATWKYSRQGDLVQKNGGIQSTVGEVNRTFLKRALCWTGWSSIVNTSFSCLTLLPSNRKTEMRPCKKKKKKALKGSRQYLTHPSIFPVQPEDLQK